ncbi:hypothetical protein HU200_057159 [Digitaria exilis]|uniref:BTB domain-containing protein n=1 Tax=Digitaria exilis TaxID=1010633 RepID=A0A835AQ28_9POAL|nr:hypothetical protein HU200_057159 [Digitaria exilis]CAB3465951.1 unnamed protein product [Digitaria exilis]
MNMRHSCSHFPEEVRSVHLLTIHDFSVTSATVGYSTDCIKSRCSVDGYPWELRLYPARSSVFNLSYHIGLELVFLGEARRRCGVTATLHCRLVKHQNIQPNECMKMSKIFCDRSDSVFLSIGAGTVTDVQQGGNLLTVECTITVIRDLPLPLPCDLHRDLGELLDSQVGANVTLAVSGEHIPVHKNILAARSPVFMAEFFGSMAERSAERVEIKDMDAQVLKAMLRFIYTGMVHEFDNQPAAGENAVMAQHLLVAADRYGLDRLNVICEQRLIVGIDIETVASTLALAEQHNCAGLKGKCIEFIAGSSPESLDAILNTEGYRHLEASSPSVLTELLRAANGKRSRS